jgi:esterase
LTFKKLFSFKLHSIIKSAILQSNTDVLKMKLNHKIIGEGFPIVVLHGLFGMLDNWQSIGKKLAENGFMVYLIDQRDHGKSPFTNTFDYPTLANDLANFMEENWIYNAHIMGHSMGGKTAMQFCFDYPDMVSKMIVVDVWNKNYLGGHEIIFQAIEDIDVSIVENRDDIYQHLLKYNLDEGTIQFLLKNIQRKKDHGYEWKMNVPLLKSSYKNILNKVGEDNQKADKETLFIRGGNSEYILPENFPSIEFQFANSKIITIENAGHWVHADKPNELLEIVLKFLAD